MRAAPEDLLPGTNPLRNDSAFSLSKKTLPTEIGKEEDEWKRRLA